MQDDKAKTESELTTFFSGLDVGLNGLREVRAAYDEQIAFDFNTLRFFGIGERTVSQILAFFLNRDETHGQKTAFLQTFLEHFNLAGSTRALLSKDETIAVECEDPTEAKRLIDITVSFKNANFVIGIENKLYAQDQKNQVLHYCDELNRRTHGNYKLLYLTPEGHAPSKESITEDALRALSDKVLVISYRRHIVPLLSKYETVCRADDVRGFIRQFQQYIRQTYLGESSMGEITFYSEHVRKNPEILRHADALRNAVGSAKSEIFSAFWSKVAECLNRHEITLDLTRMAFCDSGYSEAPVKHHSDPFEASGELKKVSVFYEPNRIDAPVYITIGMSSERKNLSPQLRSKVEELEKRLKEMNLGAVRGNVGSWWCAAVPLPHIKFADGNELCEILKDKDGCKILSLATEAADQIAKYINATETLWREVNSKQ